MYLIQLRVRADEGEDDQLVIADAIECPEVALDVDAAIADVFAFECVVSKRFAVRVLLEESQPVIESLFLRWP